MSIHINFGDNAIEFDTEEERAQARQMLSEDCQSLLSFIDSTYIDIRRAFPEPPNECSQLSMIRAFRTQDSLFKITNLFEVSLYPALCDTVSFSPRNEPEALIYMLPFGVILYDSRNFSAKDECPNYEQLACHIDFIDDFMCSYKSDRNGWGTIFVVDVSLLPENIVDSLRELGSTLHFTLDSYIRIARNDSDVVPEILPSEELYPATSIDMVDGQVNIEDGPSPFMQYLESAGYFFYAYDTTKSIADKIQKVVSISLGGYRSLDDIPPVQLGSVVQSALSFLSLGQIKYTADWASTSYRHGLVNNIPYADFLVHGQSPKEHYVGKPLDTSIIDRLVDLWYDEVVSQSGCKIIINRSTHGAGSSSDYQISDKIRTEINGLLPSQVTIKLPCPPQRQKNTPF